MQEMRWYIWALQSMAITEGPNSISKYQVFSRNRNEYIKKEKVSAEKRRIDNMLIINILQQNNNTAKTII